VERRTRSTLPFPHEPGRPAGFVYFGESESVSRSVGQNEHRLIADSQ
jgi:hypothetical protein